MILTKKQITENDFDPANKALNENDLNVLRMCYANFSRAIYFIYLVYIKIMKRTTVDAHINKTQLDNAFFCIRWSMNGISAGLRGPRMSD